jgi:hypothetical protein
MKELEVGDKVTIKKGLKEEDTGIFDAYYRLYYEDAEAIIMAIEPPSLSIPEGVCYRLDVDGQTYKWKREWLDHVDDEEQWIKDALAHYRMREKEKENGKR